ncbi:hypothetical protein [uncultured Methanobrevibacter sp.]|uniref:hypothetical protein n=1 Tax=uncultured Methanobrevibacter sp. TaxID=253161 RepID=UPI0025DCF5EC|nr:hypothetical protein [uncultured Methanobrevibacter sp.]
MTQVRLQKVEEKTFMNRLESFLIRNARFVLPLGIVTALILFAITMSLLCGICAVESGALRNFIASGV